MPRIFDNVRHDLLTALTQTLQPAERADFCVGYFNLRGWDLLRGAIADLDPQSGPACRLLVGMPVSPRQELMRHLSLNPTRAFDLQQCKRRQRDALRDFRTQLSRGAPNNQDEAALRDLARQLKSGKLAVKLFTRYPLHAKLYLAHRDDFNMPTVAFLGSSNLTLAGLKRQGELNAEVTDFDACAKLRDWFEERWEDRYCIDITEDLIAVIDQSWAREKPLIPYEIYIKIAWHLSGEARAGLNEYQLPREFEDKLLDYQAAAVKVAARYLNQRNGVLLGDVVGLGKTLMASALAKIFQDDQSLEYADHLPQKPRSDVAGVCRRLQLDGESAAAQAAPFRNCPSCGAIASSSSTRATTCATAKAGAMARFTIISPKTRAASSSCPPRPTTKASRICRRSCGSSSPKRRHCRPSQIAICGPSGRRNFSSNFKRIRAPSRPLKRANSPTTGAN